MQSPSSAPSPLQDLANNEIESSKADTFHAYVLNNPNRYENLNYFMPSYPASTKNHLSASNKISRTTNPEKLKY